MSLVAVVGWLVALPSDAIAPSPRGEAVALLPLPTVSSDGRIRVRALALRPDVRAVEFAVDGSLVKRDRAAPFGVRLERGDLAPASSVTATALGADGLELGSDRRYVHPATAVPRLDVAVEEDVVLVRGGSEDLELEVVEFFGNGELLRTVRSKPFTFGLSEVAEWDYLRIVGHFDDGSTAESVRLVGVDGFVDVIDVPEVELPVIVRHRTHGVLANLGANDFRLLDGGEIRPLTEVRQASDVPLTLGLVVDSSGSLEGRMDEIKAAAAEFVRSTMTGADRGFLVDFDALPRSVVPAGCDRDTMITALTVPGSFSAGGDTALLDAVVYGLLRFEVASDRDRKATRRALVVFTDGGRERSQVDLGAALGTVRTAGVPVYAVLLAEPVVGGFGRSGGEARARWRTRAALDRIARESGGRVVMIDDVAELPVVYEEIAVELSGQYRLAFRPAMARDGETWRPVRVEVEVPGAEARTVAGFHVPR